VLKQGYFDLFWFNLAMRLCMFVVMLMFSEILSISLMLMFGMGVLRNKTVTSPWVCSVVGCSC
jgi:hypothetical protein